MTLSLALSLAFMVASWAAVFVAMNFSRRTRIQLDHARRAFAFTQWARGTQLVITAADGRLFTRTLYDLQDEPADLIWSAPIGACILRADPSQETDRG